MTDPFRQLLNRYAMTGFERQLLLMELLGPDHDWKLAPKDGTVDFGEGRVYRMQLLGTRAEDGSWLWAWGNEDAPVPAASLTAVKKVRQVGRKRMVPELIEAEYPPEKVELDAHTLALVATSIAELPAYYRFPYSGGALYAALEIPGFALAAATPARCAKVIGEVVSRMTVDERIACETYLSGRGAKLEGDRASLLARFPGGASLQLSFDDKGALSGLKRDDGTSAARV